jgi:monoterpene epsilon-lactone hydrolase
MDGLLFYCPPLLKSMGGVQMPSLLGLLLREELRLVKPITRRLSIQSSRKAQNQAGVLMKKGLAKKVQYFALSFPSFEASIARRTECREEARAILYLQGGSYMAGGLNYSQGFGGILTRQTGQDTLCAAYRLAPEHPFPAALEDALVAFDHLLSLGYAPENISLAGESAGGGLCLALALSLKKKGRPLPGRLALISPWCNLTRSEEDYAAMGVVDPTLSGEKLAKASVLYGGDDLQSPFVSPVFGEYAGFPPVLIYVGSQEYLLDDAKTIHLLLEEAQVPCALRIAEGMWHAYVLYGVPEAKAALSEIGAFLRGEAIAFDCQILNAQ